VTRAASIWSRRGIMDAKRRAMFLTAFCHRTHPPNGRVPRHRRSSVRLPPRPPFTMPSSCYLRHLRVAVNGQQGTLEASDPRGHLLAQLATALAKAGAVPVRGKASPDPETGTPRTSSRPKPGSRRAFSRELGSRRISDATAVRNAKTLLEPERVGDRSHVGSASRLVAALGRVSTVTTEPSR
jgi:hypothetical protein